MRDMRTEIAECRSDSKDAVEVANAVRKFLAVKSDESGVEFIPEWCER